MPVKSSPAVAPVKPSTKADLSPETLKLITKVSAPLVAKAQLRKEHMESAEKSTFELYADFRDVTREHFPNGGDKEKGALDYKAARKLAFNVLATVYDIPESSINIDGRDKAAWVYPAKYPEEWEKAPKKAGKAHPKAGQEMDYDNAGEDDKALAEHPKVDGASRCYQFVSRLIRVAYPANARAKSLVDEVLGEDGECIVGEDRLNKLAAGSETTIQPKQGHGGNRQNVVYDTNKVTEEVKKIAAKAWDGGGLLNAFKGKMDLDELSDVFESILSGYRADLAKAVKSAEKAKKNEVIDGE